MRSALLWLCLFFFTGCGTKTYQQIRNMPIGEVDLSRVEDGSYTGSFSYWTVTNTVRVTVADSRITAIEIVQGGINSYGIKAHVLTNTILEKQTPNVDTVSGATTTSKALMKAVENALQKGLTDQ